MKLDAAKAEKDRLKDDLVKAGATMVNLTPHGRLNVVISTMNSRAAVASLLTDARCDIQVEMIEQMGPGQQAEYICASPDYSTSELAKWLNDVIGFEKCKNAGQIFDYANQVPSALTNGLGLYSTPNGLLELITAHGGKEMAKAVIAYDSVNDFSNNLAMKDRYLNFLAEHFGFDDADNSFVADCGNYLLCPKALAYRLEAVFSSHNGSHKRWHDDDLPSFVESVMEKLTNAFKEIQNSSHLNDIIKHLAQQKYVFVPDSKTPIYYQNGTVGTEDRKRWFKVEQAASERQ